MHKTHATTFHEHASILVPGGTVLAAGVMMAGEQSPVQLSTMSLPQLAIFLIVAYAVGHMLQVLSTLLEGFWWKRHGGMPIDWVRQKEKRILTDDQRIELGRQVQTKLGMALPNGIEGLSKGQWYFLTRQILAYVQHADQAEELHHLTGNYELNRGIAAGALALAAGIAIRDPLTTLSFSNLDVYFFVLALCAATLAAFQMERFGVQYALELFCQFIVAPGRGIPESTSRIPDAPPSLVA